MPSNLLPARRNEQVWFGTSCLKLAIDLIVRNIPLTYSDIRKLVAERRACR